MIEPRPGVIRAVPGDVRARDRSGPDEPRNAYRAYRNGKPVTLGYQWRARAYPWAQRALAAAEAEHGPPVPTCISCGGPVNERRAAEIAGGTCYDCAPPRPALTTSPVVVARPARPASAAPSVPCRRCGYLTTALGHRIECGDG